MSLKTNQDKLVKIAVQGKIAPSLKFAPFEIDNKGAAHSLPSVGGITYNVLIGDPAFGWIGDHIEPGVSTILDENKRTGRPNAGFNYLSCVGNEALIVSGKAKGKKGVVCGHHGGVEHVLVDFDQKTMDILSLNDSILIKGFGQGLKFNDYPDVKIYNIAPSLLAKIKIMENNDGILSVPVTAIIPAAIMGSGIGSADPSSGDYDVTTQDTELIKTNKIDKICLGDIVAIMDADCTFGRSYLSGAVTIGTVIHTDSIIPGHGPGVTILLSSAKPLIKPFIDKNANIGKILKIGRYRRKR